MLRKLIFIMILGVAAQASELTHEFKNPSFSGNGYSTHVLSIEQLRYSRKNDVRDEQRRLEHHHQQIYQERRIKDLC